MLTSFRQWLQQKPWVLLLAILLFATFTRFWRLSFPAEYYFDEVYHVVTAKLMAQNDPRAYEWWHPAPEPNTAIDWLHPPLAKLTQALSMNLVGMTSFGWRLSSAVFGVGVIGLTWLLAKRLGLGTRVALLAAFLASLDGLLLVMSRITMNDIHVTFFFLLTLVFYLDWRKNPSFAHALLVAASAGLAVTAKWSGVFVVLAIGLDQLYQLARQYFWNLPIAWKPRLQFASIMLLTIPVVYLLSYGQMWLQGKDWEHFWQLHEQIWWYQTNLEATHPYQSSPAQWLFTLRPVYAFTSSETAGWMRNIYIQGNPVLLWGGAFAIFFSIGSLFAYGLRLFSVAGQVLRTSSKQLAALRKEALGELRTRMNNQSALVFLLIAYFSTWIVWVGSPRIMFFYHYTPAVPLLAILLSFWLIRMAGVYRWLSWGYIALVFLTFILFYPNWTGIAVPAEPFSNLYFALPSWR